MAGWGGLPHCGIGWEGNPRLQGKERARIGTWKCNEKECRKQFTVKVGTVFEHGRIPLNKMLQAVYLLCWSKKGCSSHQLHRILGITYKSAWFLSHRIREAMRTGKLAPMGGCGRSDCRGGRNLYRPARRHEKAHRGGRAQKHRPDAG